MQSLRELLSQQATQQLITPAVRVDVSGRSQEIAVAGFLAQKSAMNVNEAETGSRGRSLERLIYLSDLAIAFASPFSSGQNAYDDDLRDRKSVV